MQGSFAYKLHFRYTLRVTSFVAPVYVLLISWLDVHGVCSHDLAFGFRQFISVSLPFNLKKGLARLKLLVYFTKPLVWQVKCASESQSDTHLLNITD